MRLCLALLLLGIASKAWADPVPPEKFAYVVSFTTGFENVVKIRLSDGSSTEVVSLPAGDLPRGVAVDGEGNIYVGLRGGSQNVKKFAPNGTPLGNFTASIGGFGTGLISFHQSGDLIVAGDISGGAFRYDGMTGALVDVYGGFGNNVGLLVDGDHAYVAGLFNGNIARHDLSGPPAGTPLFVAGGANLNQPIGMTIGHNGNLFVGNLRGPLIQEFDINTGAFVGTLVDLSTLGIPLATDRVPGWVSDFHYDPHSGHYFFTVQTDTLYEITAGGSLFAEYQSDELRGAYGFTIVTEPVPEPPVLVLSVMALMATFLSGRRHLGPE